MTKLSTIDYLFGQIIFKDDEKAFQEIFFDFFDPLCTFAHRYIQEKEKCEDIVQEVFFQLWQNRKKIVITTSAHNYLVTNVKNACINFLRHQELEKAYIERLSIKIETSSTNSETILTLSELEEIINATLAKLPDNVRYSFKMSRFEDKTYTQIATECNISIKTVEAHIGKALKLLRQELKDYLPLILLFFMQIHK